MSIFIVQVIGLITIGTKYTFSDGEDKILEITREIIKKEDR